MAFELSQVGSVHVARLQGRLDSHNAPDLERGLRELLDTGGARLLFDLAGLDYISSAGLRVLLLAAKKLRTGSPPGRVAVSGVRGNVREVFEMSGFLTLFPVGDSVDAALAQLNA